MLRLDKTRRVEAEYNFGMRTNPAYYSRCFSLLALFALLGAATLHPLPAHAQSGGDAAAILVQSLQATGGSAWAGVRSLHIQSTTLDGGVAGTRDEWDDAQTGRYVVRSKNVLVNEADGFDGVSVWTQGAGGYSYVLGDEDAREGAINQAYQTCRAFWFPERGNATPALVQPETENGQSYDVIGITPQGRTAVYCVDRPEVSSDRPFCRAAGRRFAGDGIFRLPQCRRRNQAAVYGKNRRRRLRLE